MHTNTIKKIKIFITDDHTILRDGLKKLLESQKDIKVIGEAGSGKETINKFKKIKADILILDIGLPDINGIELAKKLLEKYPDLKIIILSMYELKEYLQEVIKIGIKGYVVKKAADDELIEAVKTVSKDNIFIHSALSKSFYDGKIEKKLSKREKEVLILVAKGFINKEIANKLNLSIKTIETYRKRILKKLELKSRAEITQYAIKQGLIIL